MQFTISTSHRHVLACGIVLGTVVALGVAPCRLPAAEAPATNKSGSGAFVSFIDGRLTLQGKSGLLIYDNVGENYQAYQNNEEGPGSRLVGTVQALSGAKLPGNILSLTRVMPGTMVRVNVEEHEICFGLDDRVIGTLVSYQDGKLNLLAADAPSGFVQKPTGNVVLTIDPSIPALQSIDGGDLKFAGSAGEVLKTIKQGTLVTARSERDIDSVEVIEVGKPRRRMERYIGQTRGPVRGTFVSFKDDILRIQGKGVRSLFANEYDRLIAWRIADDIPIFESIDGGAYQPANIDALRTAKEGTIITIRKVEDVILGIQVGVAK